MVFKYLIALFAILTGVKNVYASDSESLDYSNLPFRYELDQVASNFQWNLRQELSNLQLDMYYDFLNLTQEIDTKRRSLTEKLTAELSGKVDDVMMKFNKVIRYSKERTRVLDDQMKDLMVSLGNWVEHGQAVNKSNAQRRRRHLHDGEKNIQEDHRDTSDISEISDLISSPKDKNLTDLELDNFPMEEHVHEINKLLENSNTLDIDLDNLEHTALPESVSKFNKRGLRFEMNKPKPKLEYNSKRELLPRNCFDHRQEGSRQNGVYVIYPSGKRTEGIEVWCDQESQEGGWTTIIKRHSNKDHSSNFSTMPTQYVHGFGIPSANHWIGLDVMHELTEGRSHVLQVKFLDQKQNEAHAFYGHFRVGGHAEDYKLEISDYDVHGSTAGDALTEHSGRPFVFPLPDQGEGCSHDVGGGWWFIEYPICYQALPTGQMSDMNTNIEWAPWDGSRKNLKFISFMIRPSVI